MRWTCELAFIKLSDSAKHIKDVIPTLKLTGKGRDVGSEVIFPVRERRGRLRLGGRKEGSLKDFFLSLHLLMEIDLCSEVGEWLVCQLKL